MKAMETTPTPFLRVNVTSPVSNGRFPSRGFRIYRLNKSTVQLSSVKSAFSGTKSTREDESGPETTRALVAASTSSIANGKPFLGSILAPVNIDGGGEFMNRSLNLEREDGVSERGRSIWDHDEERWCC